MTTDYDVMYDAEQLTRTAIADYKAADCDCGRQLASRFVDEIRQLCAEYVAERTRHTAYSTLERLAQDAGMTTTETDTPEQTLLVHAAIRSAFKKLGLPGAQLLPELYVDEADEEFDADVEKTFGNSDDAARDAR